MTDRRSSIAATMTSIMSPVSSLRTLAVRRGVLGGSRVWMVVAAALWGARLLRRASGRRPESVSIERLEPGQTLQITALPRAVGRSGRSARP